MPSVVRCQMGDTLFFWQCPRDCYATLLSAAGMWYVEDCMEYVDWSHCGGIVEYVELSTDFVSPSQ